eukprot:scaffold50766_cov19-Prasinocladus_malaysianus.AAC.1
MAERNVLVHIMRRGRARDIRPHAHATVTVTVTEISCAYKMIIRCDQLVVLIRPKPYSNCYRYSYKLHARHQQIRPVSGGFKPG